MTLICPDPAFSLHANIQAVCSVLVNVTLHFSHNQCIKALFAIFSPPLRTSNSSTKYTHSYTMLAYLYFMMQLLDFRLSVLSLAVKIIFTLVAEYGSNNGQGQAISDALHAVCECLR